MYTIHDVDAPLLLALMLAAKRRPAELVEIMAATDLLQGAIPSVLKLSEAFARLGACGLISEVEGRFTLTADAQQIVADQPKKAETAERIFGIKEKLAAYKPQGEHEPVDVTPEQLNAAILAHRAAGAAVVKNLLVPKPKPEDSNKKRPGQRQRKPLPAKKRRKD